MTGWRCVGCGCFFETHQHGCTHCFAVGSLLRVGVRPAALIDSEPEITDARALAKAAWSLVSTAAYPMLRLGRGALVVLYGSAGSGKSSFATRALDGLRGPVVYVSSEERSGPSLFDRLARCRVRRPDFVIVGRASVDQVVHCVKHRNAVGLTVDSVQVSDFDPDDLRHMLAVLPSLQTLIAVAQCNKRGVVEGRERLRHEADVVIRCADMSWSLEKSRFQSLSVGSGSILTDAKEVPDEAR